MIGKLLERWVNRYYRKDVRNRSVMLIQGEKDDTLVKVCGTKNNLKVNLYIAMISDEDIREIVLQAAELYRETEGAGRESEVSEQSEPSEPSEAQSGFDEDGRSERASLQRVTRRNR